jgi:hypothetical protein
VAILETLRSLLGDPVDGSGNQLYDPYSQGQDHQRDTTDSQQTGEPRLVPGQEIRHPESQNGDAEGQVYEPVEKPFPKEDGLDKEVAPYQHEDPRALAAFGLFEDRLSNRRLPSDSAASSLPAVLLLQDSGQDFVDYLIPGPII